MSFTNMYYTAYKAQMRLCIELEKPDPDLRRMVGHGNLLDDLNDRMCTAGQIQHKLLDEEELDEEVDFVEPHAINVEELPTTYVIHSEDVHAPSQDVSKTCAAVTKVFETIGEGYIPNPHTNIHIPLSFSIPAHYEFNDKSPKYRPRKSVVPLASDISLEEDEDDGYDSDIDMPKDPISMSQYSKHRDDTVISYCSKQGGSDTNLPLKLALVSLKNVGNCGKLDQVLRKQAFNYLSRHLHRRKNIV